MNTPSLPILEDGRSVARASRLARLAADLSGRPPEEHLGDAWMISRERCSNRTATDKILRRDDAGLISAEGVCDGIDPDMVGAGWALAAETAGQAQDASLRKAMWEMLRQLPERHHYVLARRYGLGGLAGGPPASVNELAERMTISPARMRQIEDKAIRSLRSLALRAGLTSLAADDRVHRVDAPERWKPSRALPDKARWIAAMLEAGGRPHVDLWGWHACPLAAIAMATDPVLHPYAMLEASLRTDPSGQRLPIHSCLAGGLRMEFVTAGGVMLTKSIEFISGARYEMREWTHEKERLRIYGDLHLPPVSPAVAKSLLGRPISSITNHWALQGDLTITRVRPLEDGSIFSITGRTRQMQHGAGRYLHPMGLSCP